MSATDSKPLDSALATALAGNEKPLYDFLCRVSGLPGVRVNTTIVTAFAEACAGHGKRADALLRKMAALHPDEAPGGTALEFLPVCATAAIGLRVATDPRARDKLLPLLHDLAEDMRFRVRDEVPAALANVGARDGTWLLGEIESWMDGFFHAAAVLRALSLPQWLSTLDDAGAVAQRFARGFALLDGASRSDRRYPGYKALVDATRAAPRALASRFGVPIFEVLRDAARTSDPDLAELVRSSMRDQTLRARYADEVRSIEAVLDAAAPKPRDPSRIVHGTRKRGRK